MKNRPGPRLRDAVLLALSFCFLACLQTRAAMWLAGIPMLTGRAAHTATLLQNGMVLVAGGYSSAGPTNSAELYDPTTGLWAPTGSLNAPRYGHTATLLQNGQVLVAGGYNTDYLTSAELYDPATGLWTFTGSLNTGRYDSTATLMPDGEVLVVGGSTASTNTTSAELYDPVGESWTETGSLNDGRVNHTATLLPDGRVLVAGGSGNYDPSATLSSMELFDPSVGSWILTGPMVQARSEHTATLLPDGQVLFTGGSAGVFPISYLSSAELYDPVTGTNTLTGAMSAVHALHSAALLPNGKVLVAGGITSPFVNPTNAAEVYDPSTGAWSLTNALNTARFLHTATLLASGELLVAGGATGSDFSGTAGTELYDQTVTPITATWTNTSPMHNQRVSFTMTLLPNGNVLAAGGQNGNGPQTSSAELYDPIAGTWTNTGPLNAARFDHTATLLPSGKVLVAGGLGNVPGLSSAELYDPVAGIWTNTGSMNTPRYAHTATLLHNGKVLVAGQVSAPGSAELYDWTTEVWTVTGQMINPRSFHKAVLLPDGRVLVVGGVQGSTPVSSAELYDPVLGTWSPAGSTRATQYVFTSAILLPGGKVLVAGEDTNGLPVADLFDPSSGQWTPTQPPNSFHFEAPFTLLPNGRVLIESDSPETYDPVTGQWKTTTNLNQRRDDDSALLLLDGRVLVAGGYVSQNSFQTGATSAELYDLGLAFANAWRPQIVSPAAPLNIGGNLTITGTGFQGVSGGSSCSTQDSSTGRPLLQLRNLENGQTIFLLATNWSAGSFTSVPVWNFPPGYALATVFVNGIQSTSSIVSISEPAPVMTTLANPQILTDGSFQFTFTNNPGAVLGVLASTNIALPSSNWTAVGVTETAPGQFQFNDPQAANNSQRFYRLFAP